jgi:hypothetical protein
MSTELSTRTHKVEHGETLSSLALKYYGDASRWRVLQRANKLESEDVFVGEELVIPEISAPSQPEPAPAAMSMREREALKRGEAIQPGGPPARRTSAWKVIGWVIATPILAFAAFVIINMISEGLSDTQTLASKAGMSLRECRQGIRIFGGTETQAREHCDTRVPK